MSTYARREDALVVPRTGLSVAAVTSIATVLRTERTDIANESQPNTPLPRRARKQVAASCDALSAEKIATRLQELVAIQRFLHARDARR